MRITCPLLSAMPSIQHGFFTREGGVSQGAFAMLNCGFGAGDNAEHVAQNRGFVARALGVNTEALCTAYQTHSAKAMAVNKPWPPESPLEADALVTATPGIAIGVLTADCLPILLADGNRRIIGAVHAGWKGTIGGVIEAGINAMVKLGANAEDITASIGPGIDQCSYEVGTEFRDRFFEENKGNERYFDASSRDGHFMFDLKAYAESRLAGAGVKKINILAHDTCLEENLFFSYRRACQRGEPAYGRQISAIALTP